MLWKKICSIIQPFQGPYQFANTGMGNWGHSNDVCWLILHLFTDCDIHTVELLPYVKLHLVTSPTTATKGRCILCIISDLWTLSTIFVFYSVSPSSVKSCHSPLWRLWAVMKKNHLEHKWKVAISHSMHSYIFIKISVFKLTKMWPCINNSSPEACYLPCKKNILYFNPINFGTFSEMNKTFCYLSQELKHEIFRWDLYSVSVSWQPFKFTALI